jgi:hypothetical protein
MTLSTVTGNAPYSPRDIGLISIKLPSTITEIKPLKAFIRRDKNSIKASAKLLDVAKTRQPSRD